MLYPPSILHALSSILHLSSILPSSIQGSDGDSLASTISLVGYQQLMFNINQLIVTVEAGVGNCTIPMILVESKLSGEVRGEEGLEPGAELRNLQSE